MREQPSDEGVVTHVASIGIGYAYYNEIMEVVAKGGFDVRGGNYNQYLQADQGTYPQFEGQMAACHCERK